ncbi:D-2-hydroxyacid dehydrogenase [Paenibacillus beijingensis]|uniref:2-hydroxyacid dehydrogenase n=1 Tax=Paenibacillus beijingensis TaxID=1126833 RepID=A0A0D5NKR4_9BACL|nr:D-2-hydroxyacid dehydrogenase [Paenibacillus beijingensis]AJY75597.1 2-hydroxyacid dehydrogenase [Paenibacillus beijingensis]
MRTLVCMFGLSEEQKEAVRKTVPDWKVVFGRPKELDDALFWEAEVVCGWSPAVEAEGLKPESKLRWLQSYSAGVDKMPLEKLAQKGVLLTTASGIHGVPMSELTIGFMLSFARGLHTAVRNQSKHNWEPQSQYGELKDKTAGIIGAGEIGTELGRLLKAFGMKTLGVRRSDKPAEYMDETFTIDRLNDVLPQCDYVVNILPYTRETEKLFNEERFALMKRSAYFINIGRGPSADTETLVTALREGVIAGAGLDVTDPEPLPKEHPLWEMDNVIITPHIGGNSDRYAERAGEILLENLKAYAATGRPARNVVDYEREY